MTATPRPWKVRTRGTQVGLSSLAIVAANNKAIVQVETSRYIATEEEAKANAALIVRAVNTHERAKAALKRPAGP